MGWHIEYTQATGRLFLDSTLSAEESFAKRVSPDAIVQIDLARPGKAYLHATMSRCDGNTLIRSWRGLARKLRALGIRALDWEHKHKPNSIDPARTFPDTVAMER
ncbi:MAG: hypothetical protein YHS30scaffold667_8 [Phage 65_10]|nr:MAG: hypothetical protein YHS30scaffold667_8 [Phage 65_10]